MSGTLTNTQQLAINSIRTLAMDAVQAANSGHPGTPMALAPAAYLLWNKFLRYDPIHPHWPGRDRFVLSCGHASMLLYSVLHLAGVRASDGSEELAISLDDIRQFRQLHSPCAGHPEYGSAAGIETTTGPLGQGVANSVGMAISAAWLTARYDRQGAGLFDFDVFAMCSDGDLMEGIGNEAASLAGHLQLSNLCWIYDNNGITIEGSTKLAYSDNVDERFRGLGWNVLQVEDANDLSAIEDALHAFKANDKRPTLIILNSIIAYGAPNKANTAAAHGAPLGEDEVAAAKQFYGWPYEEAFRVPSEVYEHFRDGVGTRGQAAYEEWQKAWNEYASTQPEAARQLNTMWTGELPEGWQQGLPEFAADESGVASRKASGKVLNAVAAQIPWLIGGSADLAGSNKSLIEDESAGDFLSDNRAGRNFHFGVREHAMAAICNGMSLSGLRPYGATFLVFTDYMRPAMRLAALMKQSVLFVLTHDSIGLGEDGPTHQPIEHLAACRAIPNFAVIRPADANEVRYAYEAALDSKTRPTALILTRQDIPTLDRSELNSAAGLLRGGYVVTTRPNPQVLLIGTGSELQLCLQAATQLADEGLPAQVISMPCWELFDEQDLDYRHSVLPPSVKARVAVEAGVRQGWDKYITAQGEFVGMDNFGESAPYEDLYAHFDITTEAVVRAARRAIENIS